MPTWSGSSRASGHMNPTKPAASEIEPILVATGWMVPTGSRRGEGCKDSRNSGHSLPLAVLSRSPEYTIWRRSAPRHRVLNPTLGLHRTGELTPCGQRPLRASTRREERGRRPVPMPVSSNGTGRAWLLALAGDGAMGQ